VIEPSKSTTFVTTTLPNLPLSFEIISTTSPGRYLEPPDIIVKLLIPASIIGVCVVGLLPFTNLIGSR
jgi:hypothetical protein